VQQDKGECGGSHIIWVSICFTFLLLVYSLHFAPSVLLLVGDAVVASCPADRSHAHCEWNLQLKFKWASGSGGEGSGGEGSGGEGSSSGSSSAEGSTAGSEESEASEAPHTHRTQVPLLAAAVGVDKDTIVEIHDLADLNGALLSAVKYSGWTECTEQWALHATTRHMSLRKYFNQESSFGRLEATQRMHVIWLVMLVGVSMWQFVATSSSFWEEDDEDDEEEDDDEGNGNKKRGDIDDDEQQQQQQMPSTSHATSHATSRAAGVDCLRALAFLLVWWHHIGARFMLPGWCFVQV
jgi:hypothetical protein